MKTDSAIQVAEGFLAAMFALASPGKIVVKSGLKSKPRLYATVRKAAEAAIRIAQQGNDTYFGLGRTTGTSHRAADVPTLTAAWVDVDCGSDEERADALELLESFHPPLSIIVRSASGFHGYWLLAQVAHSGVVEKLNRAIAQQVSGDPHMRFGPSALLRIPGTRAFSSHGEAYDPPRDVRVVRMDYGLRYSTEVLAEHFDVDLDVSMDHAVGEQAVFHRSLLDAVAERMANSSRPQGPRGRVTGTCFFADRHEKREFEVRPSDSNPSAVVFPTGWYHCAACGLDEPAFKWTSALAAQSTAETGRKRRTE